MTVFLLWEDQPTLLGSPLGRNEIGTWEASKPLDSVALLPVCVISRPGPEFVGGDGVLQITPTGKLRAPSGQEASQLKNPAIARVARPELRTTGRVSGKAKRSHSVRILKPSARPGHRHALQRIETTEKGSEVRPSTWQSLRHVASTPRIYQPPFIWRAQLHNILTGTGCTATRAAVKIPVTSVSLLQWRRIPENSSRI
ncbi:uncharacterized protein LOC129742152 [Uranotaenia lowii]|uniref:uncharacterized protein LOC129742152 n=1 Tax=Uranotaenia lowii TaxID=190385 RepID=UPI0024786EB2|nr:uncharacterized protein LOC129742152 [Uranotaenia lowii]